MQNAEDVVKRDPQLAHRGHWVTLNHAEMGQTIYNAAPFRSSAMPHAPSRPAPLLGEHTNEVCEQLLGLNGAEIEELKRAGVLS